MALIYIADDEPDILILLKNHLESYGFIVKTFNDGKSLLLEFEKEECDLIITDIMMLDISGYDVCREIRKKSMVPIMMVSAKNEEVDRVLGLELGSDDYISKPFSLREVCIKVKNMLKRSSVNNSQDEKYRFKDLEINTKTHEVKINDEEFLVTNKEFLLLEMFLENRNRAFSRESIIRHIWGYDYVDSSRLVDHLIKRLRKKLLLVNAKFEIETVWGFGYKVSDGEKDK